MEFLHVVPVVQVQDEPGIVFSLLNFFDSRHFESLLQGHIAVINKDSVNIKRWQILAIIFLIVSPISKKATVRDFYYLISSLFQSLTCCQTAQQALI